MSWIPSLALVTLAIAANVPPPASPPDADQPAVERAIVLASPQVGSDVAAYAIFTNAGAPTSIVAAACDCSEGLELHVVNRADPGAGMARAWPLPLAPGSRTAIEPPGIPRHLMLVNLKHPIAVGDRVTLRFQLADGRWIEGAFLAVSNSAEAWRTMKAAEGKAGR